MPTVTETLNFAAEILQESNLINPRREAKSLLVLALQKNEAFLVAHDNYELTVAELTRFKEFLQRRAAREPLQYIRGHQEFYGLDFIVTPDVLIPRPETEFLVEHSIEILQKLGNSRFCEIGIGSGCVSVAILHNVKTTKATSCDISTEALKIAESNAKRHSVSERLTLKISDVFDNLNESDFDLIVSNPPYIPASDIDNLQAEVRDFEPHIALTDGAEGLSIEKKIIFNTPAVLKPNGFLLLEIGFGQSEKISEMFDRKIWQNIEFINDLQGIPRTLKAQIKG